MSRISIDVTPEQHRRLEALAASQGKSVEEFVLENTLDSIPLAELESLLDERIKRSEVEGPSKRTVEDIFREGRDGTPPRG